MATTRYDAMKDEINARKAAVTHSRSSVPSEHPGQYSSGDVTGLAAPKVGEYRVDLGTRGTYNEAVSVLYG